MSRSSDLHLHLSEERSWRKHMTEEEERLEIIAYTKGKTMNILPEPQPEQPLDDENPECPGCGKPTSHGQACRRCIEEFQNED